MITKEKAFLKIKKLVTRFEEQIDSYKQSDYNETLTRRDFIDPFFKALGWDVDNSQGYAEAYREVTHEDKVKVGKTIKVPNRIEQIKSQIEFLDDKINQLVYQLYELTEEEIAIIEDSNK
jgi:hypothetical protein